jgi:TatA/E family protein of Tat protein translocase
MVGDSAATPSEGRQRVGGDRADAQLPWARGASLMAMGIDNPVHLLFIAVVALVVLGPRRLPELARALGKGVREFREAVGEGAAAPGEHVAHAPPAQQAHAPGLVAAPVAGEPVPALAAQPVEPVAPVAPPTPGEGAEG